MSQTQALRDYLYQVVKDAQAADRDDVCRWILRYMKQEEVAARPQRKRKVRVAHGERLVSGGAFWVKPGLLKESEEDKDGRTED